MAFYINEFRAKIQFITSAQMPSLIHKACKQTGVVSQTAYCQRAICEALARDLGVPIEDLLAKLPPNRGAAAHLGRQANQFASHAGTIEEVR